MSDYRLSAAILAALCTATPALAELKGPAELPPASYQGQQYVDSRGCVFLRAGYGGQVTWVPRVTKDRKQLCGYPKSGGEVAVAESAPAPAPKVAEAPALPMPDPAPAAKAPEVTRPATPTERAATAEVVGVPAAPGGDGAYKLACPAETPVAQRFEILGGGSKVMCTRGDGSLDGANFPVLVSGSFAGKAVGYDAWVLAGPVAPAGKAGAQAGTAGDAPRVTVEAAVKSAKYPPVTPPPGYKLAWKDDRLNPNRGKQTVAGLQEQDEIWTRTTPMVLREDWGKPKAPLTIVVRRADGSEASYDGVVVSTKGNGQRVVQLADGKGTTVLLPAQVTKSTKSAPKAVIGAEPKGAAKAAKPAAGAAQRLYVQVGSFGQPANADKAAARLKALGLKVARGKAKGGALQVVYAGPFASAAEAKAALAAARGAGFRDAVMVQ
jgi:hypothetical protein